MSNINRYVTSATSGSEGLVELATDAEAKAVTSTSLAVTPANLAAVFAEPPALGSTTPAAITAANLTTTGSSNILAGTTTINQTSGQILKLNTTNTGDVTVAFTVSDSGKWYLGLDNSDSDSFCFGSGIGVGSNTYMKATSSSNTINYPLQPCVLAYASSSTLNATGDGTAATVSFDSEVFDQGGDFATNTFTAPVTGKYLVNVTVVATNIGVHTDGYMTVTTSNNVYTSEYVNPSAVASSGNSCALQMNVITDMDANDTLSVQLVISNSTKTISIYGDATRATYISIQLLA